MPSEAWLGLGVLSSGLGIEQASLLAMGGLYKQKTVVAVHPELPVHDAEGLAKLLRFRPNRY